MATHSSVLAWRIRGMGSLVGCHLWGPTEVNMTEVTQQQQQQQQQQGDSLVAQLVKNLPAVQENPVQFLGQATHSSFLGLSWWLRW